VRITDAAQNTGIAQAAIGYSTDPPSGSVTVNNLTAVTEGSETKYYTKSNIARFTLAYPGGSSIRVALTGQAWGAWKPYSTTLRVPLGLGEGETEISFQVKDAHGVTSNVITYPVTVDRTPPDIQRLKGAGGRTATRGSSVSLEIRTTDNSAGTLQYQFQVNGDVASTWANLTGGTIPVSGLTSGANTITVAIRDFAGNTTAADVLIWGI